MEWSATLEIDPEMVRALLAAGYKVKVDGKTVTGRQYGKAKIHKHENIKGQAAQ